jgi:hypothetical protein
VRKPRRLSAFAAAPGSRSKGRCCHRAPEGRGRVGCCSNTRHSWRSPTAAGREDERHSHECCRREDKPFQARSSPITGARIGGACSARLAHRCAVTSLCCRGPRSESSGVTQLNDRTCSQAGLPRFAVTASPTRVLTSGRPYRRPHPSRCERDSTGLYPGASSPSAIEFPIATGDETRRSDHGQGPLPGVGGYVRPHGLGKPRRARE